MPTIEITDDQLERLRAVREDVAEAFAGPYGHVRDRDAFDYLLDSYTPPGDADAAVERSVSTNGDADGSVDDGTDDGADSTETESDDGTDGENAADSDASGAAANGGGGANRLQSMMSLLDDHDDKWQESGGDTPYEVELPDGETEPARTKDDVRSLLFKHY